MTLFFQGLHYGAGALGRRLARRVGPSPPIVALGLLDSLLRGLPLARCLKFYSRAPGFRQTNRDGLFGGGRPMLAFPHMVHLLPYEFASLRAGRLSLAGVCLCTFHGL